MHFWTPLLVAVYDYFQENRGGSYLEAWKEWIGQDWAGSYIERLEAFRA